MSGKNQPILHRVLENRFYADAVYDYESLQRFLSHPDFPDRMKDFKTEISEAINFNTISKENFENLTGIDFDTQEEVNKFLETEIWQPLFGDEQLKS